MRFGGLSAIGLGFLLAACADQHTQLVAGIRPQHTASTCTHCRRPQSAGLSSEERTGPARLGSNSVPAIDVERVCRGIGGLGGMAFHADEIAHAEADCLRNERAVRNELMKSWAGFDAADRAHCVSEVSGGQANYTELVTCLEVASAARKLQKEGTQPTLTAKVRQPTPTTKETQPTPTITTTGGHTEP